jgi:hypothetical protein
MDLISLLIGFVIGIIAATMAIEFGMRKPPESTTFQSTARLTSLWSVSEIKKPRVVAEYIDDVELPKDAKVVFKDCKNMRTLKDVEAKRNPNVKANFVVGEDRALILSGYLKEGELGIWVIDPSIIKKLEMEFDRLWKEGLEV